MSIIVNWCSVPSTSKVGENTLRQQVTKTSLVLLAAWGHALPKQQGNQDILDLMVFCHIFPPTVFFPLDIFWVKRVPWTLMKRISTHQLHPKPPSLPLPKKGYEAAPLVDWKLQHLPLPPTRVIQHAKELCPGNKAWLLHLGMIFLDENWLEVFFATHPKRYGLVHKLQPHPNKHQRVASVPQYFLGALGCTRNVFRGEMHDHTSAVAKSYSPKHWISGISVNEQAIARLLILTHFKSLMPCHGSGSVMNCCRPAPSWKPRLFTSTLERVLNSQGYQLKGKAFFLGLVNLPPPPPKRTAPWNMK